MNSILGIRLTIRNVNKQKVTLAAAFKYRIRLTIRNVNCKHIMYNGKERPCIRLTIRNVNSSLFEIL